MHVRAIELWCAVHVHACMCMQLEEEKSKQRTGDGKIKRRESSISILISSTLSSMGHSLKKNQSGSGKPMWAGSSGTHSLDVIGSGGAGHLSGPTTDLSHRPPRVLFNNDVEAAEVAHAHAPPGAPGSLGKLTAIAPRLASVSVHVGARARAGAWVSECYSIWVCACAYMCGCVSARVWECTCCRIHPVLGGARLPPKRPSRRAGLGKQACVLVLNSCQGGAVIVMASCLMGLLMAHAPTHIRCTCTGRTRKACARRACTHAILSLSLVHTRTHTNTQHTHVRAQATYSGCTWFKSMPA